MVALAAWVEKLFETKIPPKTLIKRAERTKGKLATDVAKVAATPHNHSVIPEKQSYPQLSETPAPVAGITAPAAVPAAQAPDPGRLPKSADKAPEYPQSCTEPCCPGLDGLRRPRMNDKGRTLPTIHRDLAKMAHLRKAIWRNWGILEGISIPWARGLVARIHLRGWRSPITPTGARAGELKESFLKLVGAARRPGSPDPPC